MEAYNTLLFQLDMLNMKDTEPYKRLKEFKKYVKSYEEYPVVMSSIMFQLFCILLGEDAKKFIKSQMKGREEVINVPYNYQKDFIDYIDACKEFLRVKVNVEKFTVLMPLQYIEYGEGRGTYMKELFKQYNKFSRRFENEKTLFFAEDNVVASDITCPRCRNNRITSQGAVQTRSMDEGMSFFYLCASCNYKFSL